MDAVLPAVDASSVLAAALADPLVLVDVGCRWGFAPAWTSLGPQCVCIGFEPDVEESERLSRQYADRPNVSVVPAGLGATTGPALLHITEDPAGNSLYPTGQDVVARHPKLSGGRIVRTVTVPLVTLDEWRAQEGVGPVDVIKLDTQGSELDVLRGAEATLEAVRAVEVEVEFNPLYDGVSLFADVDTFLRQHGFVLWRLRDLAHYSQFGSPIGLRSTETMYSDDHVATFLAGSGQLFWANAFYVRSEVAYPTPDLGWETLVRDACITAALGFHDLVALANECARASAPPSVSEVLDRAVSAELQASHRRRELTDHAIDLTGTLRIEVDDVEFQGSGWLPPQRFEWGAVRWNGPAREASIEVPVRLPPGSSVELLVVGGVTEAILDGLALEVNRVPVPLTSSFDEGGRLYRAVVPPGYASERRFTRLVLRTVDTIPWRELHPESTEETEVGIALSWVRLTAPTS